MILENANLRIEQKVSVPEYREWVSGVGSNFVLYGILPVFIYYAVLLFF